MPPDKARHEPVHVVEEGKLQEQGPVQHLDAAATVGVRIGKKRAPDPARRARCQKPGLIVLAFGPDAGCHADCLAIGGTLRDKRCLECGKVSRHILAVAVQHADQPAARRQQRRPDGGALPGTGLVAKHTQLRNARSRRRKLRRAVVIAGVVDIDDLERPPRQRGADFIDKRRDIAGFIHHRNKNRDLDPGRRTGLCRFSGHEEKLGRALAPASLYPLIPFRSNPSAR